MKMMYSNNYEEFKLLDFNRAKIDKNHVDKLMLSIIEHGYLQSQPIIVNKNFEIIDGQHRFMACKELNVPFTYEITNLSYEAIPQINNLQKNWTVLDYINFYAKQGNENYIRVLKLISDTNTSFSVIDTIKRAGYDGNTKEVKSGKYKFTPLDEIKVKKYLEMINTILENSNLSKSTRLIRALISISKQDNFNKKILIQKIKNYPTKIYKCTTLLEYETMLISLYNYNNKDITKNLKIGA